MRTRISYASVRVAFVVRAQTPPSDDVPRASSERPWMNVYREVPHPHVPVIETERLRLRAHRRTDYADCVAMWSDPIVTRFIGGRPSSPQQTWSRLLGYLGHWCVLDFGYWAIEEKSSEAFVGEIGFADFKRTIAPPGFDVPELGFALAPRAHGKGYATEATRAVVAWGDGNIPSPRTVCLIHRDNAASLRIASACGYDVFERTIFNGEPVLYLVRNRPPAAT